MGGYRAVSPRGLTRPAGHRARAAVVATWAWVALTVVATVLLGPLGALATVPLATVPLAAVLVWGSVRVMRQRHAEQASIEVFKARWLAAQYSTRGTVFPTPSLTRFMSTPDPRDRPLIGLRPVADPLVTPELRDPLWDEVLTRLGTRRQALADQDRVGIPRDGVVDLPRGVRAQCDCRYGHWALHAIVDHDDSGVLRECGVCQPPTRWRETGATT
jgi:hypothetical protein